ncbi:vWA domain-containing protein [Oleidesulfovibrio alaskensis]
MSYSAAVAECRARMVKARIRLVMAHPFFGTLCLRMNPEPDIRCRTAWTDGTRLAFNPYYVRGLSDAALQGLLAHTVMHPACQHHMRRGRRDADLWNRACDYAINWVLTDAGITLPPGYLDDSRYRGLSAEAIYAELSAGMGGDGMRGDNNAADGPEKEETQADEGAAAQAQTGDGEESSGSDEGAGAEQGDGAEVQALSQDTGDDHDASQGDPGGSGEVRDAVSDSGSSSPAGTPPTDENWLVALAQAAEQARGSGDLPGGLERLVRTVLAPSLDWRMLLDRFLQHRARNDYTWFPPSRRHVHMGMYLPSLAQVSLAEVILAIDTSGSIAPRELDLFAAELSSLLEQYETTVRVIFCDTQITGEQVCGRQDLPLSLAPEGGGGTDYRPVFRHVDTMGYLPSCLVYLTDLECMHFPEDEPPYPVLWVQTGGQERSVPFGDIIHMH